MTGEKVYTFSTPYYDELNKTFKSNLVLDPCCQTSRLIKQLKKLYIRNAFAVNFDNNSNMSTAPNLINQIF